MPSRRITPLLLLLPFLLAACAGGNQQKPIPPERHQAEFSKTQNYGEQIQQAITAQLFEADRYQGKQCTVRISLLRDGMVMNAMAEKGDPELCQAALSAVTRAKIPPAPDEQTWQTFKNVPLNFAL